MVADCQNKTANKILWLVISTNKALKSLKAGRVKVFVTFALRDYYMLSLYDLAKGNP